MKNIREDEKLKSFKKKNEVLGALLEENPRLLKQVKWKKDKDEEGNIIRDEEDNIIWRAGLDSKLVKKLMEIFKKQKEEKGYTYHFSCCAFLEGATDFSYWIFEGNANFSNSTFEGVVRENKQVVSFRGTTFKGKVNFSESKFLEEAEFFNVEFNKVANFLRSKFFKKSKFSCSYVF